MVKMTLKSIGILISCIVLILSAGCVSKDPAENAKEHIVRGKQQLIVATGSSEHWTYGIMAAMIPIWEKELEGTSFTLLEGTGGGNLLGIQGGQFHIGTANTETVFAALNGHYPFGQEIDRFRSLGILSPAYFHYFAGVNTGIESWADVRGKTVAVGARGSGTDVTVELILDAYGISSDEVNFTYISLADAAGAYTDGLVDVICGSGYPGNAFFQRLAVARDSVALSLTAADLEIMREHNPYLELGTISGNTYHNIRDNIRSIKIGSILVCAADLDEELVYRMVSLLFENVGELGEIHAAIKGLTPKGALSTTRGEELHQGAARYYREMGVFDPRLYSREQ